MCRLCTYNIDAHHSICEQCLGGQTDDDGTGPTHCKERLDVQAQELHREQNRNHNKHPAQDAVAEAHAAETRAGTAAAIAGTAAAIVSGEIEFSDGMIHQEKYILLTTTEPSTEVAAMHSWCCAEQTR